MCRVSTLHIALAAKSVLVEVSGLKLRERTFTGSRCGLDIGMLAGLNGRSNLRRLIVHKALTAVDKVFPLGAATLDDFFAALCILGCLGFAALRYGSGLVCYVAGTNAHVVLEEAPATAYLKIYQESAVRAIIACQPYRLPAAFYDEWKYFAPVFKPQA